MDLEKRFFFGSSWCKGLNIFLHVGLLHHGMESLQPTGTFRVVGARAVICVPLILDNAGSSGRIHHFFPLFCQYPLGFAQYNHGSTFDNFIKGAKHQKTKSLEEHHSAQHLPQVLELDDFARNQIAPGDGIKKSSFSAATNSRGLEQLEAFGKIAIMLQRSKKIPTVLKFS
jgi:hypothetical protein